MAQEFFTRQRKWQLVPQVEQPTQRTLVFLLPLCGRGILQQFDPVVSYTMFSAPGRGPCGGPRSCLLCNWASCRTGMLHSGHTFRTSSHLIRHLQNETPQEGRHQSHAHNISAHPSTHTFYTLNTSVAQDSQVLTSSTLIGEPTLLSGGARAPSMLLPQSSWFLKEVW